MPRGPSRGPSLTGLISKQIFLPYVGFEELSLLKLLVDSLPSLSKPPIKIFEHFATPFHLSAVTDREEKQVA